MDFGIGYPISLKYSCVEHVTPLVRIGRVNSPKKSLKVGRVNSPEKMFEGGPR